MKIHCSKEYKEALEEFPYNIEIRGKTDIKVSKIVILSVSF